VHSRKGGAQATSSRGIIRVTGTTQRLYNCFKSTVEVGRREFSDTVYVRVLRVRHPVDDRRLQLDDAARERDVELTICFMGIVPQVDKPAIV